MAPVDCPYRHNTGAVKNGKRAQDNSRDRGWNIHLAVIVTTLAYSLNHFAVAPVGMMERGMMAMMAIPIGILGGYLAWKLRSVWIAVIIHMLMFLSMVGALFIGPALQGTGVS